jgi:acyl carrier protein
MSKHNDIFNRLTKVCETVTGIDVEDINESTIVGKSDNENSLGMNPIDIMILMIHIDEEFDIEAPDDNFVPRPSTPTEQLWENRTVGELSAFISSLDGVK